ncbi:MAG TPA: hypothetical protein VLI05_05545 [Candidatus Saccharimonadia bacterium]|nr:hypothetical protein [Candidatus Saccharimonadia bacterium]
MTNAEDDPEGTRLLQEALQADADAHDATRRAQGATAAWKAWEAKAAGQPQQGTAPE